MYRNIPLPWRVAAAAAVFAGFASATLIPRISFETLTGTSELVVSGKITRSWTALDAEGKYIWTHYEITAANHLKGRTVSTVEFAEPGGELAGRILAVPGTITYQKGENVVVFLSRMPNGYLRTTGWAQGKYTVDGAGRIHAAAYGDEIVGAAGSQGTSISSLEGIGISELRLRVATRSRVTGGKVQ